MQDHGVQYKRITVDVLPEFHRQVKRRALDLETTVSDVVRDLLAKWLEESPNEDFMSEKL